MWNFLLGSFVLADSVRREIKVKLTYLAFHFVILIVVHAMIQFYYQSTLLAANAFFGLFWMGSLALAIWMRGGWVLDGLLTGYVTTEKHLTTSITRALIGFFTVESFVNNCFSLFPVYSHLGGFGLMLASAASYFMFRHMAGKPIDWGSWVWFPMLNLAVSIFVIFYHAYGKSVEVDVDFQDIGTWFTIIFILLGLYILPGVINSFRNPSAVSSTKKHSHGGSHGQ